MSGYAVGDIPTGDAAEKLLKQIRDRFQYATDQWRDVLAEARTDMQYVAGSPWDSTDLKQRKNRPTVAPDELHQYYNQVINGLRASPLGMKFAPVGGGADSKSAELYEKKARETEYRSHAPLVYITAASNAIHQSIGWLRVNTKYGVLPGERFLQEIWLETIPNPHMVLADPDLKRPDASDMKYLFFFEPWGYDEFTLKFPKAQVKSFMPELARLGPLWMKEKSLILSEYWTKKSRERELLLLKLPNGQLEERFADDLKGMTPGGVVVDRRPYDDESVCKYLTNGFDILEVQEWAGKYIPFVACMGNVIYVDNGDGAKRQILSMTRLMRAPWKLYCYYRSQQAEIAGMIPKTPVQAYAGQLERWKADWERAQHEPVAFLYFDGITPATGQNNVLPPPSRIEYAAGEHLQSLELCAEGARRAIQAAAAAGFLPTAAQRRSEKSGIALEKIDQSAQRGSFHFNDHYKDMVRQTGVVFEDLFDKVYDTARTLGVRKNNDDAETVRVNDPGDKDSVSTRGSHQVTVSAGPSSDSQREDAADFSVELLQTPAAPLVMDLIVKLRNLGPIGDEIAERLTPPQFKKPKDGEGPDPQQLMMMLQQAKEENQVLKGELGKATMLVESKKLELESRERIAQGSDQTRKDIAEINARAGIAETAMKNDAAHQLELMSQQLEAIRLLVDDHQAALDRAHEVGMAALGGQTAAAGADADHARSLEENEQTHGHALEQGEAANAAALEQQANAAALEPPAEGAEA